MKLKSTRYSVETEGKCYIMQSSCGQVFIGTPFGKFTLDKGDIEGWSHIGLKDCGAAVYPDDVRKRLFKLRDFNKNNYVEYYENSASSRFADKINTIVNDRKMKKTRFVVKCPAWAGLKNADTFTITIERGDKLNGKIVDKRNKK